MKIFRLVFHLRDGEDKLDSTLFESMADLEDTLQRLTWENLTWSRSHSALTLTDGLITSYVTNDPYRCAVFIASDPEKSLWSQNLTVKDDNDRQITFSGLV